MKSKVNVLVLYVRHGKEKYQTALNRLRDFYASFSYHLHYDLCIIENNTELLFQNFERCSDHSVLSGDNSFREFSGWDKALRHFAYDLKNYDFVHFVTSAFEMFYDGYLRHFHVDHFINAKSKNMCIGHVDFYPEQCVFLNTPFRSWVRSCFFFIPTSILNLLTPLTYITDFSKIFGETFLTPFLADTPLCKQYQAYLLNWITGEGINGAQWHSRFELTSDNFDFFKRKAIMIMNEQHLSIRMRNMKIQIIDVGYSYTHQHVINYDSLPSMES